MSKKSSSAGAAKSKAPSNTKAASTKPAASKKESAKSASDASSASDKSAKKLADSGSEKTADSGSEKSADSGSEKSADSGSEKSADSGSEKSTKSGGEKSQKQTISTSDVHYGYFSSVRTPAYRKGWDDIFGNKKSSGAEAENNGTAGRTKNARSTKKSTLKQPITLELDIDELPEELRAALSEEIRRKVKRQRVNYDKLDKAGAVRWNIVCEIKR